MTAAVEHFPSKNGLSSLVLTNDEILKIIASIKSEEPLFDVNTLSDEEKSKIDEIIGQLKTHNALNERYLTGRKQITLRDYQAITNTDSQFLTVFYSILRIINFWEKFRDFLYKGMNFISKTGKYVFKTIKLLSPSFALFNFAPRLFENFNLFYIAPPQNNEQLTLQLALRDEQLAHKDEVIAFQKEQLADKNRQIQALQEEHNLLKSRCTPIETKLPPPLIALKANHVAMEELSMPTSNDRLNHSPVLIPSSYLALIHFDHHEMQFPLVGELSFPIPPMPAVLCH